MPTFYMRAQTSFFKSLFLSLLGASLFFLVNLLQPADWGAMPLLGFFIGTIWLYVFGIFSGLSATLLGIIFVSIYTGSILPYIGWIIGYTIVVIDSCVLLMMLRGFFPELKDESIFCKMAYISIFIVGVIVTFYYGLSFFRPIIDWILNKTSMAYCFKNSLLTTPITLAIFMSAIPLAVFLDHFVSWLFPENAPSWDNN